MRSMFVAVAAVLAASPLASANLLYNGGFDIVGPSGDTTTYTGLFAGPSAADGFEVFNNTDATTRTNLIPSTLPGGSGSMIQVLTTGANCGLDQLFGIPGSGPASATFSVWVYVLSGTVGVGVGDGGNTSMSQFSNLHEQWLHLTGPAANSPANNFIVYSAGGPAHFYVENAEVTPTPGTCGLALVAGGMVLRRKR